MDVVLLEAERVGFGASGRNGGLIGSGQRKDILEIEKQFGLERRASCGNSARRRRPKFASAWRNTT